MLRAAKLLAGAARAFCAAVLLLALGACGAEQEGAAANLPAGAIQAALPRCLPASDEQARADYPELAAQLEELITRGGSAARQAGPPLSAGSQVDDLSISQGEPGAPLELSFSYRNCGDYNQDGRVAVSDLSPVGAYLGSSVDMGTGWPAAAVADGNLDGVVSPQDLAPIGANLLAQVDGYLIQRRPFGQPPGSWVELGRVDAAKAQLPPGGGGLRISTSVFSIGGDFEFRVTPYFEAAGGERRAGIPGLGRRLLVQAGDPHLPPPLKVQASAGLYGDRVQVSWEPVPGATRHLLYRDGGPPIAMLGQTGAYVDFGVPDYLAHEYYVRAERSDELSPPSASATGYLGERRGWPLQGGNSQHSARAGREGPGANQLRWSFDSTDLLNRGGPVVAADGSIFVAGQSGQLYCIRSTGYLKWSQQVCQQLSEQLRATPALGLDGSVLLGSNTGRLYAVNQSDGQLRWSRDLEAPQLSPVTVGPLGRIYAQNGRNLYCFSPSGQELWRSPISHLGLDWRCCPALGRDGTIYVNGLSIEDGSLEGYTHAFNPAGELLWSFPSGALGADGNTPTVGLDGTIYAAGVDRLHAIRPDGTSYWEFFIGSAPNSPSIAIDGTILVSGSSLFAINPDGSQRWRRDDLSSPNFGAPISDSSGNIYLPGGNIYQVCALSLSGAPLWLRPADGSSQSQAALAPDGSLILSLADGRVVALRDE